MANVILPPDWNRPNRDVTPEDVYWNRRAFMKALGASVAALGVGASRVGASRIPAGEGGARTIGGGLRGGGQQVSGPLATIPETPTADLYPAERLTEYPVDRPMSDRVTAATYNNFYEFLTEKETAWRHTGPFEARPWTIEIAGEVENPGIHDLADLERELGLEERVYRHRCVEAWAMVVPWTGFQLSKLIERAGPLSSARYIRFVSFDRPNQAVGQRTQSWYPSPYYEGLRMDEAMNELTFAVTGVYGEPLPKQHGAPIRIATPWKYGYKSPKSIVRMEFIREQPPTFWNDMAPSEYGFLSNVNPAVPHPRWSQAEEEMIGTGEMYPTRPFNGYGEWVADLYDPSVMEGIT